MGYAKIAIVGNLGRDPEMRYTPNGRPVTEFSVAVNQSTKNQQTGEWSDESDWFRCTVWGDRAEKAAEQLRKGNKVLIDGRLKSRSYTTRDGRQGFSMEISVDTYLSLEPRPRADNAQDPYDPPREPASPSPAADRDLDDLPF